MALKNVAPKESLNYYTSRYRGISPDNFITSSGRISHVDIILTWSGGNYRKLNEKGAFESIEKYFEQKTGRYMCSSQRRQLKHMLTQFRIKLDGKEFRKLYKNCAQHCTQPTVEK